MHVNTARTAFAVTAILATTMTGAAARPAAASPTPATACTPTWKLVPTPTAPGSIPVLSSVTALAANDVWIPGRTSIPWAPWILHWNGRSINAATQVPNNSLPFLDIGATSFASDADGWGLAIAGTGNVVGGVAERWHGGRWTMTPLAVPADPATTSVSLDGVATLSEADAWAVGGLYKGGKGIVGGLQALGSIVEHWDGSTWNVVPNPVANQPDTYLSAVKARSATDIWAVGRQSESTGGIVPLVEHWDGTAWSVSPTPTGNQPAALSSVSATGANDVWAVGSQTMAGTTHTAVPLVEHWDGTAWSVVPGLPDVGNGRLDVVYASGPSDVWAITEEVSGANLLLHWDGTSWTTTTLPGPQELGLRYFYAGLDGTGPDDIWAVGEVANVTTGDATPQVAHLSCGKE